MKTAITSAQTSSVHLSTHGAIVNATMTLLSYRVCLMAAVVLGLICAPAHALTPVNANVNVRIAGNVNNNLIFQADFTISGGSGKYVLWVPQPAGAGGGWYHAPWNAPKAVYAVSISRNSPDWVNQVIYIQDSQTGLWVHFPPLTVKINSQYGSFAGAWHTTFGDMTISVSGSNFTGGNASVKVTGTVISNGTVMSGRFSVPSRNTTGMFVAYLNASGGWTGKYGLTGQPLNQTWNGWR